MSRICVKNVGKNIKESDLKELFSSRGEVTDVKLLKTKDGKSRKIAFVGFRTEAQANEVQQYYNNTFMGLTKISIEIAKRVHDPSLEEAKLKHQKKLPFKSDNGGKPNSDAAKKDKSNVKAPETMSKNKAEFMEVMKSRGNSQFWGNDDGIKGDNSNQVGAKVPTKPKKRDMASDSEESDNNHESDESDDDDNSVNDFSNKESTMVSNSTPGAPLSDADYFKSKISHFSDSDDSDNEDDTHTKSNNNGTLKTTNKADNKPIEVINAVTQEAESNKMEVDNIDSEDLEDSSRLFVKNLPFTCTEEEFRSLFESFGVISEVHLPLDKEKKGKGFGFIQFMIPECATSAMNDLAGSSFQGRLLHITKAHKKLEADPNAVNTKNSKLSSFQQKKEEERRKFANKQEGWNAAFVRSDAVVESLADKYNISRSDILDTTEGGGELAVRLAIGESQVIAENKEYFAAHGVDISALESTHSDKKATKRSTTTILIKNLPFDLVEDEVESMFARFGSIAAFLVPKSRTIALVDFVEPTEARAAYKGLAYRSYKHMPMYLEWAPLGVIDQDKANAAKKALQAAQAQKTDKTSKPQDVKKTIESVKETEVDNQDEYSTLFIKNLNFITTEANLKDHFASMNIQGIRTISIQKKQKGNQVLSQGYGFVEFKTHAYAQDAQLKLNGALIDSHALVVKPSDKRLTIKPVILKSNSTAASSSSAAKSNPTQGGAGNNKLIVRNVAFQATSQEIRNLFAAFGSVKRVRIPKKMGGDHRGFAFVDFSTAQEAATAMSSLKDTHLYGRHLVLEWAKEEDEDDPDLAGLSNSKGLESLRKRARADEKVIAVENKKSRSKKSVNEDEIGDGIGSDDI